MAHCAAVRRIEEGRCLIDIDLRARIIRKCDDATIRQLSLMFFMPRCEIAGDVFAQSGSETEAQIDRRLKRWRRDSIIRDTATLC